MSHVPDINIVADFIRPQTFESFGHMIVQYSGLGNNISRFVPSRQRHEIEAESTTVMSNIIV